MSLLCLCLFVAGAAPDAPQKPTPKFQPGRDTTFVDGPLDKDGYIDYEAALNARLKGKTTPESNALVLLLKCLGPKPEGAELKPDFYKALGIDALPANGQYWVQYNSHFAIEIRAPDPTAFFDHEAKLKRQPWTKDDSPKHAEWLEVNEKPLALAIEATRRPDYFHPMIARSAAGVRRMLIEALLPTVQKHREIASLLTLRVNWNLGAGKIDDACADALAIHRLGRLVVRGGCFIELLVGIAIDALAHSADAVIFEHGRPTAKQALAYQAELMKLAPITGPADKIALYERFFFLDAVQHSIKGGTAVPAGGVIEGLTAEEILRAVDWEAVFRKGNGLYDRIETALNKPTRIERLAISKALDADLDKLRAKAKNPKIDPNDPPAKIRTEVTEILAAMYLGLLMPAYGKIGGAVDRAEQINRNGIVVAGLAAHFADRKKYPETLADLVPKYLARVPVDVFGDQPVIYKKTDTGYLLYSVGANGVDDGGQLLSDEPRGDDIGMRLPRK